MAAAAGRSPVDAAREQRASEAFVDQHYRGVYRFFVWLTADPTESEDLTQETFAAFWASPGRPDWSVPREQQAWLYAIARNRWRKQRRDRGPASGSLELETGREDPASGPESLTLARLEVEAVTEAVQNLPPIYREALVLRAWQELDYAEIAGILGISAELARWRVHRARGWLCAALRSDWAAQDGK